MNFLELAEVILRESNIPLSANEIWQEAENKGLVEKLNSKGKTPWATLGAILHVTVRDNASSKFITIGKRPKRFYLKDKKYDINFDEYNKGNIEDEQKDISKNKKYTYLEKDLHPYLSYFAYYHLRCYTKTINHFKSDKSRYGEWVHPDIVGCSIPIGERDDEVLQLSSSIGDTPIKFISFELKRELNLSTLREYFFQTVSNSSWANECYLVTSERRIDSMIISIFDRNECYLVTSELSKNEDFLSELSRLSSSFGVGIIKLDIGEPNSSEILFPSKVRENVDWETINKLTMNKDFKEFLKRVRIDFTSSEIRKEKYDKIFDYEKLLNLIKN